jgi:hypothetical protein
MTPPLWKASSGIYCRYPIFYFGRTSCSQFHCPPPRRYLSQGTDEQCQQNQTEKTDALSILYYYVACHGKMKANIR